MEDVNKLKYEAPAILVEFDLTLSCGVSSIGQHGNGFDELLTNQILTDDILKLP